MCNLMNFICYNVHNECLFTQLFSNGWGNFPVIFIHLNFDLQWRERKPGNLLFKEAYSVSLEMGFGYQVSLIGNGSA